jgi:hypothetical protein
VGPGAVDVKREPVEHPSSGAVTGKRAGRQVIWVHVMDDFPNDFVQIKSLSRSAQQHQHGVQSQHVLITSPRSVHS